MKSTSLLRKKPTDNEIASKLDNIILLYLTKNTIGEICHKHESTNSVKTFLATDLIIRAIGEGDIGLINLIVKRIDGTVPNEKDREKYANILGNAIDDVINRPIEEKEKIDFDDDLGIIAMAKAVCRAATSDVGNNISKKKDRLQAAEILLSRLGGTINEPTKESSTIEIVDPDWALPENK